jgi:integrase
MAPTDFLKLRHRTWYVRIQIPQRLWSAAGGKREFVSSLKTSDLNEANRLKHAYVAAFQRRIKALERRKPDPLADLYEQALVWRDNMEKYKGEVLFYDAEERPYYATDEFLSQISDEARAFVDTHGEKAATSFFKVAKGEGTPLLDELIDTWLTEQGDAITEQTRAQHRTAVRAFVTWAGHGVLVEDVGRKTAGEFISQRLLTSGSGFSNKTAKRYVSSLSSLWTWLIARGVAPDNPWRGQGVGKKSKRGEAQQRRQWTDTALVKVLSGNYSPRYTQILHDLTRLALVTGARLDELCALETHDAHKRSDGWWLVIREGKTQAAVREVPVHNSVAHVLERRCKSSADGFLFEGLVPGGPDKKRSWNASKAFGHYTRKLGLGEDRQVFHALRNTFIEAMEAAEVPESTTKLLIGHKRSSLTYGHYSKGDRLKLRKYVSKVRYAEAVMKLIQAPSGQNEGPSEPLRTLGRPKIARGARERPDKKANSRMKLSKA